MKTKASIFILALLAAGAAQAQLYKWVGPDGKVTYSDAPPPKTAAKVEQKNIGASGAPSTAGLPYELAQAVNNHPVMLYTGDKCDPCNAGRAFLKQRGIPFSEKTVTTNEDIARFKQATGESSLPVLTIGRNKQAGFEESAWGSALTAAGYPKTSQLPKGWQQPAAEAAAPKAKVQQAEYSGKPATNNGPSAAAVPSLPPATGNAPPGFRF
ncbi:glutaredoxin [Paucimonas lemoignei]|uniref:Glutaredoxin n=1 Tax=Paucimonas lemoignei TaxID=29443 RepID=A0A4R3HWG6_PAULE|nr:glutaredoxin family protein [Paucimonas lemoignei]TCS36591.1 glutaredoxin [Paucimonas lemoignei]